MEFQCSLCQQADGDTKLLSCFHLFCEACLSELLQHQPFASPSSHPSGPSTSLECPICSAVSYIPDAGLSSLPTVKAKTCLEHGSKELSHYCNTCEKVICNDCVTSTHTKHSCNNISEVFSHQRDQIESISKSLKEKFSRLCKALSRLDSLEGEVSSREGSVQTKITGVFGTIQEALRLRREELVEQLHRLAGENKERLQQRRQEMSLVETHFNSCLSFIQDGLQACTEQEVVLLKSALLKQFDILLQEIESLSVPDSKELQVTFTGSPQPLINSSLEFGDVAPLTNPTASTKPDYFQMPTIVLDVPVQPVSPVLAELLARRLKAPVFTLTGLKGPCGVAVKENGEIIVAEGCGDCVSVFSPTGEKLLSFGCCGEDPGEFICPCEVAVDDDGNILVVDASNRRIQKFSSDGKFLASVGSNSDGILFSEPDGIAINPVNKKIYVVSNNTHQIHILNSDLSLHAIFGKEGSGCGYLRYPWGVACSRGGEVYVTDSGNSRVQVFTPSGQYLRGFGQKGRGDGEFRWPTGISVSPDGGVVYVSDYGNHRVCVFAADGSYLHSLGKKGKQVGHFGNTRGVMVDRHGLLYVCDTDNNRVVLY